MKVFFDFLKNTALNFDEHFGTNTKEKGGRVYRFTLRLMSPVRRVIDPIAIYLRYKLGFNKTDPLRLHLGCGWKRFEGYVNVDLWINESTDVICNVTRLPWPDNSADIIENYHVIEHISHVKVRDALTDWHRVLKPGGKLVVECPHFDDAVKEYLSGNEARLINIFGRQRSYGDAHLYGYNPQRLKRLLKEIGFVEIQEYPPNSSQSSDEPSFRIECQKKQLKKRK
jgi:predicted SAM-dependent methyltransferase